MSLGSPGGMPDWEGEPPTTMFQRNLARAHHNLIAACASPIVNKAFMQGLDMELEGVINRSSGGFENLSEETLVLVDRTTTEYLSRFQGLSSQQTRILKGYAKGYVGHRLDSRAAEMEAADDEFDD